MKCTHCGAALRPGAKFCKTCGNPVSASPAKPAPPKKRGMKIGSYHAVGLWHEHSAIFWVERPALPPNPAMERYLATPEPRMLNKDLLMKLRALSHLHLARVLDQARGENGRWYLIVSCVGGLPLDTVQANLGATRATKVFEKILQGMIYLHDQGWVIARRSEPVNLGKRVQQFLRIRQEGATELAEQDPVNLLQQTFTVDEKDNPVLFDFTLWEPAPVLQSERDERVKEDMQLTVKLLYWLMTRGRLTKELEKLRQTSGQVEQFIINVLQQAYTSFPELGERFSQIAKEDPSNRIPKLTLPTSGKTQKLAFAKLTWEAATDKGIQRDHNEDTILAQPLEPGGGIFVVADGMGGHSAGEVASRMAVEEISRNALAQWANVQSTASPEAIRQMLGAWLLDANARIYQAAQARGNNMGTTLTAALVVNQMVYAANVGDSRTYLFRAGKLYPLTRDHSLVASLVQAGILKPEEVYTHPQRNEIFRALGQQKDVNADVFDPQPLGHEDRLVLCSDGLWEMVRSPEFEKILNSNLDPQKAAAELIRAANRNGGEDNISVVIVRVALE